MSLLMLRAILRRIVILDIKQMQQLLDFSKNISNYCMCNRPNSGSFFGWSSFVFFL